MSDNDNNSDLSAIFDAAREVHEPGVQTLTPATESAYPVLLAPNGMVLHDLREKIDALRAVPRRARGFSVHTTMESFVAHVLRQKGTNTAAWLGTSPGKAALSVLYNYNDPGPARDGSWDGVARWGDHGARHDFPISQEFAFWQKVSGQDMTQGQFATMLEEHIAELRGPESAGVRAMDLARLLAAGDEDYMEGVSTEAELQAKALARIATPSRLIKMARSISMTVENRAEQARDESGNVSLVYRAAVTADDQRGAEIKRVALPSLFIVEVPVIEGGQTYRLPVRLKTTIKGERVAWSVSVHRADAAFDDAVKDAAAKFTADTGVPVFRGTSEFAGRS